MIQWIIDNQRYDGKYLAVANKAASKKAGEPTWSNAPWLVKVSEGKNGKFLHAKQPQAHRRKEKKDDKTIITYVTSNGTIFKTDPFVVVDADGKPVLFDPNDKENVVVAGQILFSGKVGDFEVKSSLQILHESARTEKHSGMG